MQNQRTKMCPNCEGNVELEVSICPYCGSSVFEKNEVLASKEDQDVKSLSYEETLASLYPPPYKPKVIDTDPELEDDEIKHSNEEERNEEEIEENEKSALIPSVLFWIGVNTLVFSLILLLSSKDGVLYLKWNATYWFLYSLIAIPFLYLGFRGLKNLE